MSHWKALLPRLLAAFVLLAGVFLATAANSSSAPSLSFQPAQYPFKFVIYGDLRTTNPANTKDTDPVRRMALINKIAGEQPGFVAITGDLVLNGGNAMDWAEWDKETKPWSGLQVFPILGNHDVRGGESALPNFFQRFPQLQNNRYYAAQYGKVRGSAGVRNIRGGDKSPEMRGLGPGVGKIRAGT